MMLILVFKDFCLAIFTGVLAATPKTFENSASYAFGNFSSSTHTDQLKINNSIMNLNSKYPGWPNGYVFIPSFLSSLWAVGALDSTVHKLLMPA